MQKSTYILYVSCSIYDVIFTKVILQNGIVSRLRERFVVGR